MHQGMDLCLSCAGVAGGIWFLAQCLTHRKHSTNTNLINDEGKAVSAVLPILVASFDSLMVLGNEIIFFIPSDTDNSKLSFHGP